ncbi:MAG TPA: hypothetical protein VMY59_05100 [Candidatus Thermoplasmatota archaeon]|nr:hypothetical protein [Candidatus Thermoplasmatota archaeon]
MTEGEFFTKTTIKINGELHELELLAFDTDGITKLRLDKQIFSSEEEIEIESDADRDVQKYQELKKSKGKALFHKSEKLEYNGAITIYRPVVIYILSELKKEFIKEDIANLLMKFWEEKLKRDIGGSGMAYAGQYLQYLIAHDLVTQNSLGICTKTNRNVEKELAIPAKLLNAIDLNDIGKYLIAWCDRRGVGIINVQQVLEYPLHTSKLAASLSKDDLFAGCKLLETAGEIKQIGPAEFMLLKKEGV